MGYWMNENKTFPEGDIPWGDLAAPAQRALARAGFKRLEDFTKVTECQVGQLHGIGPKAINILRSALASKGYAFASPGEEKN